MAPEQRRGAPPDPRHDLYSLGVMWYQLLCGDVSRELHPGWPDELIEEFHTPPRELLALGASLPRRSRPGERFDYSNTNFIALGLIAEAAAGRPLREQLEARIFAPLGLEQTDFLLRRSIDGRHARGYLGLDAPWLQGRDPASLGVGGDLDVTEEDPAAAWASGGIVSTLADVAALFQALLGGRLLRPAQTRELTSAGGMGMVRARLPCGGAWGKGGQMAGYVTRVSAAADGSRVAVAMINRSGAQAVERVKALSQTGFCSSTEGASDVGIA
jgi:D-alanyl-D-alanine carboxypeptidase